MTSFTDEYRARRLAGESVDDAFWHAFEARHPGVTRREALLGAFTEGPDPTTQERQDNETIQNR